MLSAQEQALLGRLELAPRRPVAGLYAGQRRSPRTARSPEFADFRPYSPGDDVRQVDWPAYARLERLLLRLHVAEDETALNAVVDASLSMRLGTPSKWECARRLAAALASIAARGMDRVAVGVLARGAHTQHGRGRAALSSVSNLLAETEPAGEAAPAGLASQRWLRPGITLIISDFLVDADWAAELAALRARRQEPVCWQLLTSEDQDPRLAGDFELVDVESERGRELTVTPFVLDAYRRHLAEHQRRLRLGAEAAGGRFLVSTTGAGLGGWLADGVRAGVLKRR